MNTEFIFMAACWLFICAFIGLSRLVGDNLLIGILIQAPAALLVGYLAMQTYRFRRWKKNNTFIK